ncbi:MAG: hypothetical protein E6356_13830 [Terrisporobacter othiniensis]|nr:hypothetical protein [Terrisporobacter othiniensis]
MKFNAGEVDLKLFDGIDEKMEYFEKVILENGEELKGLIEKGIIEKGDNNQFTMTIEVKRDTSKSCFICL